MKSKLFSLVMLLPLTACADAPPNELAADPAAEVTAVKPVEVVVNTRDFAFDMPDTIEGGVVTFRLVNEGPDFHHLNLIRLDEGKTLADFERTMQAVMAGQEPIPSWIVEVGGPNTPGMPGGTTNATLDLAPGNYLAACFIPGPDGQMHIMKGMVKPLTVVAGTNPATLPEADVVMTLNDYSFVTSKPLTAGKHVIRIQNAAEQSHEVVFVKLEPGKTPMDVAHFLEKPEGAPPGTIIGGIAGLSKGVTSQIEIELEAGEYALLCFLPDASDGKPHVAHGMAQQITIT